MVHPGFRPCEFTGAQCNRDTLALVSEDRVWLHRALTRGWGNGGFCCWTAWVRVPVSSLTGCVPQPRCLASLCLSVLICKMEISKPYLMGSLQKTK